MSVCERHYDNDNDDEQCDFVPDTAVSAGLRAVRRRGPLSWLSLPRGGRTHQEQDQTIAMCIEDIF